MIGYIVLAALIFGLCFLVDKGFSKVFRSKKEHQSGLAVRLNKRYALLGLVLVILGILGILTMLFNTTDDYLLLAGGVFVLLLGSALVVYYISFGIYYDDEGFLASSFGKKSLRYRFGQIQNQRLYVIQGGNLLVELYLEDGKSISVQSGMEGAYPFLNHAFSIWCRQTGRNPEECDFHDPAQGQWFPGEEET